MITVVSCVPVTGQEGTRAPGGETRLYSACISFGRKENVLNKSTGQKKQGAFDALQAEQA